MVTEAQIRERLEGVLVPGPMRSLVQMNLVRGVAVSDQKVKISLASAALGEGTREWLREKVDEVIRELPDVKEVETDFVEAKPAEVNQVQHVVAVMSGKGGVGKSLGAASWVYPWPDRASRWAFSTPTSPAPASPGCLA